ncbi:hypothetical protein [Emticicia fontis]
MEDYKAVVVVLTFGVVALFVFCVILFVLLYRSMQDNATLQYQNACFTAESSQEKTFGEIYNELEKVYKAVNKKQCEGCKVKNL